MARRTLNIAGSNRLIAGLQGREKNRIVSSLEVVRGVAADVLFRGRAPISHVYFPTSGIIALTLGLAGGSTAEIGMVGNEGMAGLPLLHRTRRNRLGAHFKIAGDAMRMRAVDFLGEIERRGQFENVVHHYAEAFFSQVAQSAACNARHSVEQRLCRSLLMSHDRVSGATIDLTHAEFAKMLGVRRAGVSAAAARLQKDGSIRYVRGVVEVVRRTEVEARSCECYADVRREFERLLSH